MICGGKMSELNLNVKMKFVVVIFTLLFSKVIYSQEITLEKLQGKWQSFDDKTNVLWFDGNLRKETNDGKVWDSEPYVISSNCMNPSDAESGSNSEDSNFISCEESDLCWMITSLTSTELSLTYMGRGNTLRYKRIK